MRRRRCRIIVLPVLILTPQSEASRGGRSQFWIGSAQLLVAVLAILLANPQSTTIVVKESPTIKGVEQSSSHDTEFVTLTIEEPSGKPTSVSCPQMDEKPAQEIVDKEILRQPAEINAGIQEYMQERQSTERGSGSQELSVQLPEHEDLSQQLPESMPASRSTSDRSGDTIVTGASGISDYDWEDDQIKALEFMGMSTCRYFLQAI